MDTDWSSLALLRFLLAFIVLCGHLRAFTAAPADWVLAIDAFGGKAAVVGFLLVSGYSIAASLEGGGEGFYRRRFLRIYPLYFCAVLFAVTLQIAVGDRTDPQLPAVVNGGRGWFTVVGNFLLLQTFVVKPIAFDGPLWSLGIEVSYYLIAPFLLRLRAPMLAGLVAFSMACYLLPKHADWGPGYFVLSKLNALRYFWCWGLGFMVRRNAGAAVALLSVLGVPLVLSGQDMPEPLCVLTYLCSLTVVGAARQLRLPERARALADYLGDVSYPLYLFHFPAFLLLFVFLGQHTTLPLLAGAFAITLASFHVIDRHLKPRYLAPLLLGRPRCGTDSIPTN